jgi:8-oxo-dGTP pyrophosphatase MutT (NUDIX family)
MAESKFKTSQLSADQFVVSAGSVLFDISPQPDTLRICIVHSRTKDEWLLPKGRKDRGESIQSAAVRETFEETGYQCVLFPVNLQTRATIPGVDHEDRPQLEPLSLEPIAVTIRHISETNVKIIWWFVTQVDLEGGAVQREDTHMASEDFEATFFDVEDAIEKLTFSGDKDIATTAFKLVRATHSQV